ncbi:MAG: elongation factor G [Chlamydiota bacterium]
MVLQTQSIRNIGLVGHSGSGKTTFSEAMLYSAGVVKRMGKVDNGNTVSDYHPDEVEHKMSIHSSVLSFNYNETFFNVIDMPGYADFAGDVKDAMHICDMSLFLVDALNGPQIGSDRAWKFADEYHQPRMICLNGLDKENASFARQLENLRKHWGPNIIPLQIPVSEGPEFCSVIDLLSNKLLTWHPDTQEHWKESEIPSDLQDIAAAGRQQLTEAIAEADDQLLEKYFETETLDDEDLKNGLSQGIINRTVYPVVCSSAFHNVGIDKIMEIFEQFAPIPSANQELRDSQGKIVDYNDKAPTSAIIFKTMAEKHIGELSFFRVCSGSIHSGHELHNSCQNTPEKVNQIFLINGKNRCDVTELPAGSIAAVVKLKNTHTGDTLADPKVPTTFEKTHYPSPSIRFAIEPVSKGDEGKFGKALATLHEEDPTFSYTHDNETGQTIIAGLGELHIQNFVDRIKRQFKIEVATHQPKIPYRETIKSKGDAQYRHKKQSGGAGQFAEVWLRVEPLSLGSGIQFTNSLVGQNVDRNFVPSVEKGVRQLAQEGVLAKNKITDLKVDFYDGKMHPVDSSDMAFQLAGRGAFKEAFLAAQPYLLEPIYEVEIQVPEEHLGNVMGDISSRRGQIQGMTSDGGYQVVKALVPLANLHKYSTVLRSLTHGSAEHSEKFSHYDEMPASFAKKVIEEQQKKHEK